MQEPLPDRPEVDPDHARYLYRLIEAIRSGHGLDSTLRHVIRLACEATGCRGCFVYLLQGRDLVLRVASRAYSHAEGRIRLSIDEGLVGWAARTRRSVSISDRAYDDPRVVPQPELHGEHYQSMTAVPILSRTGAVLGVIGTHAKAPRAFSRREVEFMEHAALLVAGAIEAARHAEEASTTLATLTALSDLARQVAATSSARELLPFVARSCRGLLGADRCDVYLTGAGGRLVLRASNPARALGRSVDAGDLARQTRSGGMPMWAPLVAEGEHLGVLFVLVPRPTSDVRSLLATVAANLAIAVKRHQQAEARLAESAARDLLAALAEGRPAEREAARMGCDLAAPHVVLHARPWAASHQGSLSRFHAELRTAIQAAVVDLRDGSVCALLPVGASGADALTGAVRSLHAEVGAPLAVGLSNPGAGAAGHLRSFAEAESAAQVGALLRRSAGVFTYEELGAYRYALDAGLAVRDRHQASVELLHGYQRRGGTDLVRTLETFLELRGSIAQTSRRLRMHPNTLRQRLARIEQLTGLRIDDEDCLSLAMAIKAVTLRRQLATAAARPVTSGGASR